MIGLAPEVCIVIGSPRARAWAHSLRAVSTEIFPRSGFVSSPMLREQKPNVNMPSLGIHWLLILANPEKSMGKLLGAPWAAPYEKRPRSPISRIARNSASACSAEAMLCAQL